MCAWAGRGGRRARHRTRERRTLAAILLALCIHCDGVSMVSPVQSSGGSTLGAALVCGRAPGLTERQRAMCRASPAAVAAIGDGLRMAYAECRAQMAGRRWNCSGVGDSHHFHHVMPRGTREAAFTYAITSAGVTLALGAACARGDLPACACSSSSSRRQTPSAGDSFWWGGCGEAAWGARLARRWLDARELERDARAHVNLHNNRAGRKVVAELSRRECKCHGVSGSCALRTCWRAPPSLRAAALGLAARYGRARRVELRGGTLQVVRRSKSGGVPGRGPRKADLVYLEASPSYCEPEPAAGALGTHHRTCNNTSTGEDGCESLCCGRGYSALRRTLHAKCRCRFHWCCRVTCDTCTQRTVTHVCN